MGHRLHLRSIVASLIGCLILQPIGTPSGIAWPHTQELGQRGFFETEALAELASWTDSTTLTSSGPKFVHHLGAGLAYAVVAGVLANGTLFFNRAHAQRVPPPQIRTEAVNFKQLSISPFAPGHDLLVDRSRYARLQENFRQIPWLGTLYQSRFQSEAQRARSQTFPTEIANNDTNAGRYGPLSVALAVEFQATRDPVYFNQARRLLLALARGFHSTDRFVTDNDGLDFSIYFNHLLFVYDMLHDNPAPIPNLTDAERNELVNNLFRPAATALLANLYGSNTRGNPVVELRHQKSNHLTAVLCTLILDGLTIGGDEGRALVDYAVNNPHGGLLFQLTYSLLPNGFWWENSGAYHLYTLHFFILSAAALERVSVPIYAFEPVPGQSIQKMVDTLVRESGPTYAWPFWGDGEAPNLKRDYGPLVLIAHALKSSPGLGHLIMEATAPPGPRDQTLLEEAIALTEPPPSDRASASPDPGYMPEAGVAILRSDLTSTFFGNPQGKRAVFFESSPFTNNAHAQGSRNTFSFSVGGQLIAGAMNNGSAGYRASAEEIRYFRSMSYPTILIDGQDQKGSRPDINPETSGRITYDDGRSVEGFTDDAYPEPVAYYRQVRLTHDGYMIDFIRIVPRRRGFNGDVSLVVHGPPNGVLTGSMPTLNPASRMSGDPFNVLTGWQAASETAGSVEWIWRGAALGSKVVVLGQPTQQTSVRVAQGPSAQGQIQPVGILTRAGGAVSFVTVYFPIQGSDQPNSFRALAMPLNNETAQGVLVQDPQGTHWHIAVLGEPGETIATLPEDPSAHVSVRGKTGDVHILSDEKRIEATGEIANFRLPDIPGGITSVTLNGQPVIFTKAGGYIEVTGTPYTQGPIRVPLLPEPPVRREPPFGISDKPALAQNKPAPTPAPAAAQASGSQAIDKDLQSIPVFAQAMFARPYDSDWMRTLDQFEPVLQRLLTGARTIPVALRTQVAAGIALPISHGIDEDTVPMRAMGLFVSMAQSGFLNGLPAAQGPIPTQGDKQTQERERPLDQLIDGFIKAWTLQPATQLTTKRRVAMETLDKMFFQTGGAPVDLIAKRLPEIKEALEKMSSATSSPTLKEGAAALIQKIDRTAGPLRGFNRIPGVLALRAFMAALFAPGFLNRLRSRNQNGDARPLRSSS